MSSNENLAKLDTMMANWPEEGFYKDHKEMILKVMFGNHDKASILTIMDSYVDTCTDEVIKNAILHRFKQLNSTCRRLAACSLATDHDAPHGLYILVPIAVILILVVLMLGKPTQASYESLMNAESKLRQ